MAISRSPGAWWPRFPIAMTSWPYTTCKRSKTLDGCWPTSMRGLPGGGERLVREVLAELKTWTENKEEIALATVVETWGSSPRPLGSKMVVTRSGKMAGSVSNGCIESAVFEEAQKVMKAGKPKLAAFGVADDVAFSVRLACGGHIEAVLSPPSPAHEQLIALLQRN